MTNQLELITLKRDWIEAAVPVVAEVALESHRTQHQFSTDDLHHKLPPPSEPNWFGVLLAKMKADGYITHWGYKTSNRKEANGRAIRTWIGIGRNVPQ